MKYNTLKNLCKKHNLKIPFEVYWKSGIDGENEILVTITEISKHSNEPYPHYYVDENSLRKLEQTEDYYSIKYNGFFEFSTLNRFRLSKQKRKNGLPIWF